ncbi:UNVERIFIED_CONTAM: hypothetical protein NCL1_57655 [Trichonephila clavipes]
MGCYSWFTVFDTLNEPFAVQRSSVIHMPVATLIFNLHRDDQFIPGQKTGMYFSLHSPHISADNPADNGIFMKLGKVYRIYVSMEKEVLLPHPYETACVNYTDIWRNRNKTGPRTQEVRIHIHILYWYEISRVFIYQTIDLVLFHFSFVFFYYIPLWNLLLMFEVKISHIVAGGI